MHRIHFSDLPAVPPKAKHQGHLEGSDANSSVSMMVNIHDPAVLLPVPPKASQEGHLEGTVSNSEPQGEPEPVPPTFTGNELGP